MAILISDELAELRRECAVGEVAIWNKTEINVALQSIEDWFEANKANLSITINTATTPFIFTAAQKKKLIAYWLRQKFIREVV